MDDLTVLHDLLGHYARQHGDIQKLRIAVELRIGAMERDGIQEEQLLPLRAQLDSLDALEHDLDRHLERLMKRHPIAPWIRAEAKGLSLRTFALLFGITGPLDRFETVPKLWKYLGLHVVDGHSARRTRGERLGFASEGRVRAHLIGTSIVKSGGGGRYREAYDRKRAEYLARPRLGDSGCPFGQEHRAAEGKGILACVKEGDEGETSAHVHAAAMRYAVKRMLRDLWKEWRRVVAVAQAA